VFIKRSIFEIDLLEGIWIRMYLLERRFREDSSGFGLHERSWERKTRRETSVGFCFSREKLEKSNFSNCSLSTYVFLTSLSSKLITKYLTLREEKEKTCLLLKQLKHLSQETANILYSLKQI